MPNTIRPSSEASEFGSAKGASERGWRNWSRLFCSISAQEPCLVSELQTLWQSLGRASVAVPMVFSREPKAFHLNFKEKKLSLRKKGTNRLLESLKCIQKKGSEQNSQWLRRMTGYRSVCHRRGEWPDRSVAILNDDFDYELNYSS